METISEEEEIEGIFNAELAVLSLFFYCSPLIMGDDRVGNFGWDLYKVIVLFLFIISQALVIT